MPAIRADGRDERGRRVVIELHLIGYTEDAEYLVFDLDDEGEGRYLLPVDPDLLATLEAVRDQRMAAGLPVDERTPASGGGEVAATVGAGTTTPPRPGGHGGPNEDDVAPVGATDGSPAAEPEADDPTADVEDVSADVEEDVAAAGSTVPAVSLLSPAQIQAQLRSGRTVRAVARDAGTDVAWIERWQAPILAERDRVLEDAFTRRIDQPHARALGGSVERCLVERGVEPETVRWQVARRDDGRWRITVRFEEEGRPRSATWLLDPSQPHLRPQSPLATELASPRRRDRSRRR